MPGRRRAATTGTPSQTTMPNGTVAALALGHVAGDAGERGRPLKQPAREGTGPGGVG
jgi:hypothetical protein